MLEQEVEKLKNSSGESSGSDVRSVSSKKDLKSANGKKKSNSIKEDRVEAEKDRQLRVLKDKLKKWDEKSGDVSSLEEASDSDLNMKSLRKKMTKKLKNDCEKKLAGKLKQAGAFFPEESTSSGTDSSEGSKKSRAKKKVKSGAKIKKRPVVRTELWPHTIANEDDGDEVTSEDIGLAKFLSCSPIS